MGVSWPVINTLTIGPFSVHTHSLGIVVGCATGLAVWRRRALARHLWSSAYGDGAIIGILGILIGSRIGWALPELVSGSLDLNDLTTGQFTNISFFGGLAGGLIVGLAFIRLKGISLLPVSGLFSESIAIGLLIARFGDLMVADHLGKRTSFLLGYRLPPGTTVTVGECLRPGDVCHQTALYELVLLLILVAGIRLIRGRTESEKLVTVSLLIGYGAIRLLAVEPFRTGPRLLLLTGSQWFSLVLFLVGILILVRSRRSGVQSEGSVQKHLIA